MWCLYVDYQTQWRVGVGGLLGLDYTVFHHALDRKGLPPDQYDEMLNDLRIIEAAAMSAIRKM